MGKDNVHGMSPDDYLCLTITRDIPIYARGRHDDHLSGTKITCGSSQRIESQ